MIINPEETGKLPEVISEGAYYGMQTFDQALLYHVQQGRVSMEDALKAATHPHDFKLLVSSDGMRSSSAESVFAPDDAEEQPELRTLLRLRLRTAPSRASPARPARNPKRQPHPALVAHIARAMYELPAVVPEACLDPDRSPQELDAPSELTCAARL